MSSVISPTRPSGVRASIACCNAGLRSKAVSKAGLPATGPMQFTVIPNSPHSRARLFAIARWAALAGEYSGIFALPSTPEGEVIRIRRPPPSPFGRADDATRCGIAARAQKRLAQTPVRDIEVQCFSICAFSNLCGIPPMNALCTMMSSRPNC